MVFVLHIEFNASKCYNVMSLRTKVTDTIRQGVYNGKIHYKATSDGTGQSVRTHYSHFFSDQADAWKSIRYQ